MSFTQTTGPTGPVGGTHPGAEAVSGGPAHQAVAGHSPQAITPRGARPLAGSTKGGWTRWWRTWWPVLVPLVAVLVGAWIYRWVDEDAFINFRVIENLLGGHGPVFNVGERVEVYSDPLWVFTLAGLHEVLRFIDLAWLSVLLGLGCTGGGMVLAGRAVQRLGTSRGEGTVLPVGLLMFSVVAGVWEFVTSGLEMGMVFLWIGLFFWLLVRLEERREGVTLCAFVAGLGTLVRPELVLMSVVDLVALALVVAAPGWRGPTGVLRRYLLPLAAAVALPAAYEVFRAAYFAMVEPNTGLAKAAGASWWSQGFTYLWNFLAPYTLWLPLALAVVLMVPVYGRWWRRKDRVGLVVAACPFVAGLADVGYVTHVGGDYMHARLLLPGFFALCLVVFVGMGRLRTLLVLPVAGICVWSVVCAGWLRYIPPQGSFSAKTIFISNERNNWITATGNAHPITAADYAHALSGKAGALFHRLAITTPQGRQRMVVITNPYAPISAAAVRPARSALPFTLAVNVPAIGVIGYLSGPKVYIFDEFSLANPIGSHTTVHGHARPGHEKPIGAAWMVARFSVPGVRLPPGGPSTSAVAAARNALSCDPLHSYLKAITAPLTWSRAFSDLAHSWTYTSMAFSTHPQQAARQLCGPGGQG